MSSATAPSVDFTPMNLPAVEASPERPRLLDPGMSLTLRPMRYPAFYDMYRDAIKNTWTVEEVDFSTDTADLNDKMTPAEKHLIQRLVAFFATGSRLAVHRHSRERSIMKAKRCSAPCLFLTSPGTLMSSK